MGFLSRLLGAATNMSQGKEPIEVVIPFDSGWFDAWNVLRIKQEENPFPVDVKVSFDESLLKEIWNSID